MIDIVIMEGLAENAVREELGEAAVSSWAKRYNDDQADRLLERIIMPNHELTRKHPITTQILYGTGLYPNMVGYAVGYYLVQKYMNRTGCKTKDLIGVAAEKFIE
ncbi:uncharacterized protein YjaZ [Metabacillus malikii]|uniref:Uncharacterized protein YjaZ n=1 Tax=Metabacillus malikii TaxID=1504265 RepID=A0ABT9ZGD9_9BACI|nr:uncharacterized protein YjaZ [Metabacillus malikii]